MGKKKDVVEQEKIYGNSEVENAADAGEALVEEVKNKGGGNEWVNQAQVGTSTSTSRNASSSESESHQEQKQVYDPAMHKANVDAVNKGFEDGTYQSFAKMIMPQIEKEIDPAEAERKKKNADFRRSMHEVVSALQVMSDIGTSFAGGNAYKREAPNYKQYKDEKDKVDSARDAAMKRLYDAQLMDANFKNRLMELAYQKSFVSQGDTTSSQVGEGVQSSSGVSTSESAARSKQAFASQYKGETATERKGRVPIQLSGDMLNDYQPRGYAFVSENAYEACASGAYNNMATERIDISQKSKNDISRCFEYALYNISSSKMLKGLYDKGNPKNKDGKDSTEAGRKKSREEAYKRFRSIYEHGYYIDDKGRKIDCEGDRLSIVQYALDKTQKGRGAFNTSMKAGELKETATGESETPYDLTTLTGKHN